MSINQKIKQNILLKNFTTFRIGGPAEYFVEVESDEELSEAVDWAGEKELPVFFMAGGSNILVSDKGVRGLVVKIANAGIEVKGERLECGSGASLIKASRVAAGEGLSGLEWAVSVPGSVGGAIRGNAGAYGVSIKDAVETVSVFNPAKGGLALLSNRDCEFIYRNSIFKKKGAEAGIIWSAVLKLKKGGRSAIAALMDENIKERSLSQPKLPSAGCVFANLMLDDLKEANPVLASLAEEKGIARNNKVGAGWLINMAGLKGKKIGQAKVSLEHANFIVNTGGATAEDVITLISYIKQQVRDKFGVQLKEEIKYVGF